MRSHIAVGLIFAFTACASLSQRDRVMYGAIGGGAIGAAGGSMLSPNDESRGINALVFGLSGALSGGLIALLTDRPPATKPEDKSLKARELSEPRVQSFVVPPGGELPDFVKQRLSPVVIEEFEETDSIAEDGSLRAPHKVYRITRPAELSVKGSTK
jgi:hypothetical protein